jgi:hypothetical protein
MRGSGLDSRCSDSDDWIGTGIGAVALVPFGRRLKSSRVAADTPGHRPKGDEPPSSFCYQFATRTPPTRTIQEDIHLVRIAYFRYP